MRENVREGQRVLKSVSDCERGENVRGCGKEREGVRKCVRESVCE